MSAIRIEHKIREELCNKVGQKTVDPVEQAGHSIDRDCDRGENDQPLQKVLNELAKVEPGFHN